MTFPSPLPSKCSSIPLSPSTRFSFGLAPEPLMASPHLLTSMPRGSLVNDDGHENALRVPRLSVSQSMCSAADEFPELTDLLSSLSANSNSNAKRTSLLPSKPSQALTLTTSDSRVSHNTNDRQASSLFLGSRSLSANFLQAIPSAVDSIGYSVTGLDIDRRASQYSEFFALSDEERLRRQSSAAMMMTALTVSPASNENGPEELGLSRQPSGSIPTLSSPGPGSAASSLLGFATINGVCAPIIANVTPSINPLDGTTTVANLMIPILPSTNSAASDPFPTPPVPAPTEAAKKANTPEITNRSGPAFIMETLLCTMRESPAQALHDCTLGWIVLKAVWGLTPTDFDDNVLTILTHQKTPREAEEILLAIAAVDLRAVRNLSPFAKSLIKDHECASQVCMRFLAGVCIDPQCPFVHPHGTTGWELMRHKWGLTYLDFDYAALSFLCKQPEVVREEILLSFAHEKLGVLANLSAALSRTIRLYLKQKSAQTAFSLFAPVQ